MQQYSSPRLESCGAQDQSRADGELPVAPDAILEIQQRPAVVVGRSEPAVCQGMPDVERYGEELVGASVVERNPLFVLLPLEAAGEGCISEERRGLLGVRADEERLVRYEPEVAQQAPAQAASLESQGLLPQPRSSSDLEQ